VPAPSGLRADHPRHSDAGHGRLRDRGDDPRPRAQPPDPDHLPHRLQPQRHAGPPGLRPRRGRLPVQADRPRGPALEGQRVRRPVPQDRGGPQAGRAPARDREERARAPARRGEAALGGRAAAPAGRAGAPGLAGPGPHRSASASGPRTPCASPTPACACSPTPPTSCCSAPSRATSCPRSTASSRAPRPRGLQLLPGRARRRPSSTTRRSRRTCGSSRTGPSATGEAGATTGSSSAQGIPGTVAQLREELIVRDADGVPGGPGGRPARVRLLPDDGGRPADRDPGLRHAHPRQPRGRRDRRPPHGRRPVGDGARAGPPGRRAAAAAPTRWPRPTGARTSSWRCWRTSCETRWSRS
jgi:hypothetical protein